MISYNKALINVSAYLPEDNEIIDILKICNFKNDGNNWKIWFDNNGNQLTFSKNKKIILKKCDRNIITDIHFKLHPNRIIKTTNLAMFVLTNNIFYVLFNNHNEYKLCCYTDDWVENKPIIDVGLESLRLFIRFKKSNKYNHIKYNLNEKNIWITRWPPNNEFVNYMSEYKDILNSLGVN